MPTLEQSPNTFSKNLAFVLVNIIALAYIVVLGKKILAPLVLAFLFSMVLLPIAHFFENKIKLNRAISSIISTLVLIAVLAGIFYFIASQFGNMLQNSDAIKREILTAINGFQNWISATFHIDLSKQKNYIDSSVAKMLTSASALLSGVILTLSAGLISIVLIIFFTFFLLFYRDLIMKFIIAAFKKESSPLIFDIVENVQKMTRNYIIGLLSEMLIVTVVCSLAFTLLGVKYALLLGLLTGLLNIVPYLGIFTSLAINSLITLATTGIVLKAWLVAGIILSVHIVDSNLLLPFIVGSRVKINALVSLMGIVIGELLWGIVGMFLSIPVLAIAKIIFDHIQPLKHWGLLLGHETNSRFNRKRAE